MLPLLLLVSILLTAGVSNAQCWCDQRVDGQHMINQGKCVSVIFMVTATMPGQCDQDAQLDCTTTNTPCKFDFDLIIQWKTLANRDPCCFLEGHPVFQYQDSHCDVDKHGNIVPGTCSIGFPIPITVPFIWHIDDWERNCGKHNGFAITEHCGANFTVLLDIDFFCANCK